MAALAAVAGLSACTIETADAQGDEQAEASAVAVTPTAPEVSVKDGATDVNPGEPVTVTGDAEGLAEVELSNEEGTIVEAELSADKATWTTAEPLGYNRTYTLLATGNNGKTTEASFSTATPTTTTGVALVPVPDSTVGVGQAINFIFTTAPTDRVAVEEAITVTTSNDTVGAFYWVSANELRWRPEEFWEPGTEVTVDADIYGLDMGNGLYGSDDNATNFIVGDHVETIVDDATKTMTVYRNGEALRTMPVSLGRDNAQWATPNGTYVVGDEHSQLLMDSTTFGYAYEDGGYSTMVDYATQLSYSGIYVHAAPWSVGAQGNTNTSHGCINVSTEDAAWFQQTVRRGDPVIVKNTVGGTLSGVDGLGHWNIDWDTWEEGNATY
ncbi:MAG TPA: Ig-like domain-containing protein [Corynebacterium sp.]|nr:Ig-like domain-containing protein [Corynebacterium sp.]